MAAKRKTKSANRTYKRKSAPKSLPAKRRRRRRSKGLAEQFGTHLRESMDLKIGHKGVRAMGSGLAGGGIGVGMDFLFQDMTPNNKILLKGAVALGLSIFGMPITAAGLASEAVTVRAFEYFAENGATNPGVNEDAIFVPQDVLEGLPPMLSDDFVPMYLDEDGDGLYPQGFLADGTPVLMLSEDEYLILEEDAEWD